MNVQATLCATAELTAKKVTTAIAQIHAILLIVILIFLLSCG
jgi:hypothetical protein